MIDPHLLAESPDVVRARLRRRGADAAPFEAVDRFVALHALRRAYIQEGDALRARRNTLSREIGAQLKAGQTDAAEALKAEVHAGAERVAAIDLDLAAVQAEQERKLIGERGHHA
jgi:seryl-tRNA synthetase